MGLHKAESVQCYVDMTVEGEVAAGLSTCQREGFCVNGFLYMILHAYFGGLYVGPVKRPEQNGKALYY